MPNLFEHFRGTSYLLNVVNKDTKGFEIIAKESTFVRKNLQTMKKILFIILTSIVLSSCGGASKLSKADLDWSYEIESIGVGVEGTYAVRIWSYYKKPEMPVEIAKKNAIHATIFKGISAGGGAVAQPALIESAVQGVDNTAFFNDFFTSEYQRFINSVSKSSAQVLKTGKNEYRIGYTMSVSKDALRKYLEEQGVLKALSYGF